MGTSSTSGAPWLRNSPGGSEPLQHRRGLLATRPGPCGVKGVVPHHRPFCLEHHSAPSDRSRTTSSGSGGSAGRYRSTAVPPPSKDRKRMASWMAGARSRRFKICVIRARETWARRARSAWSATSDHLRPPVAPRPQKSAPRLSKSLVSVPLLVDCRPQAGPFSLPITRKSVRPPC